MTLMGQSASSFRPVSFSKEQPQQESKSLERATITVKLPTDTVLYVDGAKNSRTDTIREFSTPPLPTGTEFSYVMKAERMRNGQPETQTQTIHFRAGELVTVDFTTWPSN